MPLLKTMPVWAGLAIDRKDTEVRLLVEKVLHLLLVCHEEVHKDLSSTSQSIAKKVNLFLLHRMLSKP